MSREIGCCLEEGLKLIFRKIKFFFSAKTIQAGNIWLDDIVEKLRQSSIGILLFTKENTDSTWMAFEAGAIANNFGVNKVIPIIFDGHIADLNHLIRSIFQSVTYSEDGIKHVLESINDSLPEDHPDKLSNKTLELNFRYMWTSFSEQTNKILNKYNSTIPHDNIIIDTGKVMDDMFSFVKNSTSTVADSVFLLIKEIKPLIEYIRVAHSGSYLFIDGENEAFSAITSATFRANKCIHSTRFSPMSIIGNQDDYGKAISSRVIGNNGYSNIKYSRIVSANSESKLEDIKGYFKEFRGHNFVLYLTKKTNPFELVIIDRNEVFIHFYGVGHVINSTLHIVGEEVAKRFIELYAMLHHPDYDPNIKRIDFLYLHQDDVNLYQDVERFFDHGNAN